MKKLTLLVSVLAMVGFVSLATAEVRSVKISGDLEVKGIYADNWADCNDDGPLGDDTASWYETIVRIQIDAGLTDNVDVCVRLSSDRDWDSGATADSDVDVDLAYIELSEVYDYPLSLTIGRQELSYGEAFLIGDGDPVCDVTSAIDKRLAFDAIKAVYDADTCVVDIVLAKIDEDALDNADDEDLYGVNVNIPYQDIAVFDIGLWYKNDNAANDEVLALSLRGEGDLPGIPGLSLKAELVPEWTDVADEGGDAFGGYIGGKYTWENIYEPYVALNYIYMKGDASAEDVFDPLYEDEVYGIINEGSGLGGLYLNTNLEIINLCVGYQATDTVALALDCYFMEAEDDATLWGSDDYGNEYDLTLTYDYTEDVQMGLALCLFAPEDDFGEDDVFLAMGTVTVTF